MLGKFCKACQAIPRHGYCKLAGCPMPASPAQRLAHREIFALGHDVMEGTDGGGSIIASCGDADFAELIAEVLARALSSEAQSPSQDGAVRAISAPDEPSSLSSAEAQNVRLREVLELAYQAIGAWVCTYADDMVGEDALEAARSRIAEAGGTLAYTAEISEAIREALTTLKDTSNEG